MLYPFELRAHSSRRDRIQYSQNLLTSIVYAKRQCRRPKPNPDPARNRLPNIALMLALLKAGSRLQGFSASQPQSYSAGLQPLPSAREAHYDGTPPAVMQFGSAWPVPISN